MTKKGCRSRIHLDLAECLTDSELEKLRDRAADANLSIEQYVLSFLFRDYDSEDKEDKDGAEPEGGDRETRSNQ